MKKAAILFVFVLTLFSQIMAKNNTDSVKTALIIIDVQEFYFPSNNAPGLMNVDSASLVAKALLSDFRDTNQLVVHVRHQSSNGMNIHENVAPLENEKVITKTEINSFNGTDLLAYLTEYEIERLIIIGMQTHMCIEAATRAAYDFGFECVVVEDACATRAVKYGEILVKASDVHASTLGTLQSGGYCEVINYERFKKNLGMYLFKTLK